MITIAQVSDLHFGGPPDAARRTERVITHLCELDPLPDVLLVTGDVADHGHPEEYAAAAAALAAWHGPVLVGPGNHDVRGPFADAFGGDPNGALDRRLDLGDVAFLMLDSLVPAPDGERIDPGELASESLAWLDEELGRAATAIVCVHHPPVTIGIELMDPIMLRSPEALEQVLRRHECHVVTLVGHAHTPCATLFAGRPLLVGGGVASTVSLDAEPLPVIWEGGPPSFALHLLDGDRLTTHWRALPV